MYWDKVKDDCDEIDDAVLCKAIHERKMMDITHIAHMMGIKHGLDPGVLSLYAAVAYGLNNLTAIEYLRNLKNDHRIIYSCYQWGNWMEKHDIEPFAQTFELWSAKNWWHTLMRMIKNDSSAELDAVLRLHDCNGCKVVDPLENESRMLWETCIWGKRNSFDVLLPISDFQSGGYRCFIAAVHNDNLDIAQTLLLKSHQANVLDELRRQVDDYVVQEVDISDEYERVEVMYAMMDKFKITDALQASQDAKYQKTRRM